MGNPKPIVAVAGAGRMGIGIAQVFAFAGFPVNMIDIKERSRQEADQALSAAARQITGNLASLAELGVFSEQDIPAVTGRISYYPLDQAPKAFNGCQAVFEAVPEILEVKEEVFHRLGSWVGEDVPVASTTSTFLVDTLAAYVKNPARFMNTHWLNPAFLIPVVEVSPGEQTSPDSLNFMMGFLEEAGKVPVKCAASPGFIIPRIQALAMNEAARLAEEGVASPEDIDKACRLGFGLRFAVLGLLEFIDWGGGDILFFADNYLKEALKTDRFSPPEIVVRNMQEGHTGIKTGQGFYDFSGRDMSAYQRETMAKFVDLLRHLGLMPAPVLETRGEK